MKKHPGTILLSPRVTEKGAYLSERGCYVFNVAEDATKHQIADAMYSTFKVKPRKVTVARIMRKARVTRGSNRKGMSAGGKKAYVYLKKGDTIDLV